MKLSLRCLVYLVALFVLTGRVAAQSTFCGDAEAIFKALKDQYGEEPVWTGNSGPATVVVMAAPGGGTWTVVTIEPGGQACMRGSGMGWQAGGSLVEGEKT